MVIDADERAFPDVGDGFGDLDAHEKRAAQAGAVGDRDGIDLGVFYLCGGKGFFDEGESAFEVSAACDLRDDAAIASVKLDLAGDTIGEEMRGFLWRIGDLKDRDGGFITGAFEGEEMTYRHGLVS